MSLFRRAVGWLARGGATVHHDVMEQLRTVQKLLDECRLRSALDVLDRLDNVDAPAWGKAVVAFQHGAVLWTTIGDGAAAREQFQRAVDIVQSASPNAPGKERLAQSEAYAAENLMLLSLSYDEFFQRAERLEALAPHEPVLREHVPIIRDARKSNQPWSQVMTWSAQNYFDVDPSKDPGRHGCAASFFQLMLTNRRALRLSREQHASTLIGYSALLLKMWAACGETQLRKAGRSDVSEFRLLVEPARPLLDEFLEKTPGHERVQECRQQIENCCNHENEMSAGRQHGAQGPALHSVFQEHFETTRQIVGGPDCVLHLREIEIDGPNIFLEYGWNEHLSDAQADGVDTKARAFLNCAVGTAAELAGLSCGVGPNAHSLGMPNGQMNPIPGWYLPQRQQPTYVVNSQFDAATRSVYFTIGTPQVRVDTLGQHDPVSERLAAAFQQAFSEIHV